MLRFAVALLVIAMIADLAGFGGVASYSWEGRGSSSSFSSLSR
jgi:hypothetical protein